MEEFIMAALPLLLAGVALAIVAVVFADARKGTDNKMKSLETIQKTFGIFRDLSKAATIIAFIACGAALVGLFCGIVWYSGGSVYGLGMEQVMKLTETSGLKQMIAVLMSDAIFALTDGILCRYAFLYFKAEQEEGTPFTYSGAERIKSLGIKTIAMPLVAAIITAVIYECFEIVQVNDWSNAVSVVLGAMLILVSLVFRYGAELEAKEKGENYGN